VSKSQRKSQADGADLACDELRRAEFVHVDFRELFLPTDGRLTLSLSLPRVGFDELRRAKSDDVDFREGLPLVSRLSFVLPELGLVFLVLDLRDFFLADDRVGPV